MFDVHAYWERIGFAPVDGESAEDQFVRLHRCHSFAVPFEDFNSFCGVPVSLAVEDIFHKVVYQHRGGYCFELNRLFHILLEKMDYTVTPIFCRPFSGEGVKLPMTHRMALVSINENIWVADVGLGGNGWVDPLRFVLNTEQTQWGRIFRIVEDPELGYVVQVKRGENFVMGVAFDLKPAEESDFIMSNYYTSTCPSSPFVNRMMCTLPTPTGRYTIRDTKLKIEGECGLQEYTLTADSIADVLSTYFSLVLTEPMLHHIQNFLLTVK